MERETGKERVREECTSEINRKEGQAKKRVRQKRKERMSY